MEELVVLENEQVVTTSVKVAEDFGKRHDNVMTSIEAIKKDMEKDPLTFKEMFREAKVEDSYGRDRRAYYMNKDGFTLLAMGFTGKKALEFKLKYIEAFNKMEQQLQEIYHISETALTNNVMNEILPKITNHIDDRLEMYEENYRPTHANKMNINRYIKSGLGNEQEPEEADLVKQRVLLMLDAENWQDVPYKKLINNMRLIDESIQAVKGFRTKRQLDLFESYV